MKGNNPSEQDLSRLRWVSEVRRGYQSNILSDQDHDSESSSSSTNHDDINLYRRTASVHVQQENPVDRAKSF